MIAHCGQRCSDHRASCPLQAEAQERADAEIERELNVAPGVLSGGAADADDDSAVPAIPDVEVRPPLHHFWHHTTRGASQPHFDLSGAGLTALAMLFIIIMSLTFVTNGCQGMCVHNTGDDGRLESGHCDRKGCTADL